jgi:hypothetical protein
MRRHCAKQGRLHEPVSWSYMPWTELPDDPVGCGSAHVKRAWWVSLVGFWSVVGQVAAVLGARRDAVTPPSMLPEPVQTFLKAVAHRAADVGGGRHHAAHRPRTPADPSGREAPDPGKMSHFMECQLDRKHWAYRLASARDRRGTRMASVASGSSTRRINPLSLDIEACGLGGVGASRSRPATSKTLVANIDRP